MHRSSAFFSKSHAPKNWSVGSALGPPTLRESEARKSVGHGMPSDDIWKLGESNSYTIS